MPYIKQSRRNETVELPANDGTLTVKQIAELVGDTAQNVGELNYIFTKALIEYGNLQPKYNYEMLNSLIGMLECCKQEFYRMEIIPYENDKMDENGVVD
jgi:hypothetical protein|tara:strand:+ start:16627 stop:16923 length:297 start_codon:yes stop_codon:yes gene_type:complete